MKSTIFVGETPTDVYWLKNDRADLKRAIVVIPGNPGIIEFYKTFLHGLFEHFEEQIPVVGISHAGHGADSDKIFSVQEQIQHKVQFLSQELPDAELVLVGHSVGSYISLHVRKLCKCSVQTSADFSSSSLQRCQSCESIPNVSEATRRDTSNAQTNNIEFVDQRNSLLYHPLSSNVCKAYDSGSNTGRAR